MKHLKRFNESIFDEPSYRKLKVYDYDDDQQDEVNNREDIQFSKEEMDELKSLCDKLGMTIFDRNTRLGLNKKIDGNTVSMVVWKNDDEWYKLYNFTSEFYEADGFDSLLHMIEKFYTEFIENLNNNRINKGQEPIK
jgi:hypothetical protein